MYKYEIKMIEVDGSYKALVIDLDKQENRLVNFFEDNDYNECKAKAQLYVMGLEANQGAALCH